MFLEIILKLQVKPTFIIPSSYLTLPGSILLPEVLPEVPPEVPLDVNLDVHLEVLTSSDQEKSLCRWLVLGGWVKTKFIIWLRSKSLSFEFSELDFARL